MESKQIASFSIYHDFVINAEPNKVFQGISDPTHLVNWWPLKCSGKNRLGEDYNFYFTEEYNWFGIVIKCEPSKAFHIQMTKSDPDWNNTTFGFDLEQSGTQTKVQFWHIGWPECNHHFKQSSYCWAILMRGLKDYLEKGTIVPFEERE